MLSLSFLDQSIVPKGTLASEAISNTIHMAKLADAWGFHRFWVSEHHNSAMIAGSAPELLMVRLASETHDIRIGSGGIMLPNHSALKVAENFRLLETMYPGRIDLGMGRAPGGDRFRRDCSIPPIIFLRNHIYSSWNISRHFFMMKRQRNMDPCWQFL